MTKKRYVKLLMSMGHSRNDANACACEVAEEGGNYQEDYDALINALDFQSFDFRAWNEALTRMAESMRKVSTALSAACSAFRDTFRRELE